MLPAPPCPVMFSSSDSEELEAGDDAPRSFEDLDYTSEEVEDPYKDEEDNSETSEKDEGYPLPNGWSEYPCYGWVIHHHSLILLTELFIINPILLSQANHCLNYLKDRSWIDMTSIDIWLMHAWEALPQPRARYIPSTFIPPNHGTGDTDEAELDKEIDSFRGLFDDLPDRGTACPLDTLVYVLNCGPEESGNHFCVVVFAPSMRTIYILGKNNKSNKTNNDSCDWESWKGREIWKKACQLMGWSDLPAMELRTVDWKQNGYDCGPIACQVAQDIFSKGLRMESSGQWKRPVMMPCCHALRLKMAELVHHVVMEGSKEYRVLRDHCHGRLHAKYGTGVEGMAAMHDTMEEELNDSPVETLQSVVKNLREAMQKCVGCHKMREDRRHHRAAQEHPIPLRRETVKEAAARHKHETLKGTKSMRAYTEGSSEREGEIGENDGQGQENILDQELESTEEGGVVAGRRIRSSEHEANRFPAVDRKQARIGRFPRPVGAPRLPPRPHLRGLNLPFDRQYDDYEGGPVLEELSMVPETHLQLQPSFMYICKQILLTPVPHSLFKDYGYRLLPCFAQAFDLGRPILVRDHLCPVGLPEPPESITDYISHNDKGRHGERVNVNDLRLVGAESLLGIADEEGDDGILLTGQVMDGDYVCVDLLRDHVEPNHLDLSCDVDSMIWITKAPKFQGPVAVYSVPVIRDRAPIWKNNHVEIQVLHPQSEDDQLASGGREEWLVTAQSLSTIPHLQFGVVQGSSVVELLLFFPRMMHRDPHRHFRVNRIPKGIQDFFWDYVLLPALSSIIPSTRSAYLPVDRSHTAFKMGSGKHTASFALDPGDLDLLIKKMKKIVRLCCRLLPETNVENLLFKIKARNLDQFGSFFFVVQIKGSKGVAHAQKGDLVESMRASLDRFKESFPALNWSYMKDRRNGELICDVGVTVQPVGDEPLVGLWRLDCLDASFGAGGYKSGNLHTLNTLSMFGGLQAESPASRRKRTHIAFRSSYNLAYEVTRKHDNSRNLFDERLVFQRDPRYHTEMGAVQGLYTKAAGRSYGVRDEFRVGGSSLEDILECIGEAVSTRPGYT